MFIVLLLSGGRPQRAPPAWWCLRDRFCSSRPSLTLTPDCQLGSASLSTTLVGRLPFVLLPAAALGRLIAIVLTRGSGCGRARSICNKPLSSQAPFTSI